DGFGECRGTGAEQTERDCRIKVAGRDVQGCADKCRDGQTMRQRDAEHIVSGRFNGADSDEDKSKCSNKFREPGTKFFHGAMRSNYGRSDKRRVTGDETEKRKDQLVTRHYFYPPA